MMKAVCWHGAGDVRVDNVTDPKISNRRDSIVRVTSTAICGSDLHLYDGYIPLMQDGDIIGHEFMGEVVEAGHESRLKPGDRVVVPFDIGCGACVYCKRQQWSLCDNSNPTSTVASGLYGQSGAGMFGYSHIFGGFSGGQAQYVRVPYSDVGPIKVPEHLTDEQVLFLSDIFPTGYMAAENCNIKSGDTVAVWGCGPVGQFAIRSAYMLGAGRVIAIDRFPERLQMAHQGGAEIINYEKTSDVVEILKEMTGGMGPDSCIDAVGMESHGASAVGNFYDRAKQALKLESDRAYALRQAIQACGKGGTVSIAGVYGGMVDSFPIGAAFAKGLTFKMGQTHVQKYMQPLLDRVERGDIDPSFVITHRFSLEDAPRAYKLFRDKQDECIKVVLKP
jgi:threonine dehydrogenase-like Zn-dependent dehydrogenase